MRLKESLLSRRWFVSGLIYGWLGAIAAYVAYPLVRFLFHKKVLPLPRAVTIAGSEIEKIAPNSVAYFKYGHLPAILLKTDQGELRAFSAKCTHLDCTVQYRPGSKKFFCACHDGFFNDKGQNIAGPPPSPLVAFHMSKEGDMMVISHPQSKKEKLQKV